MRGKRRSISLRIRFAVLKRDGFVCRYCGASGRETELQVDHVVPVALGGTDDMGNLRTACWECNMGKRDHPLDEVRRARVDEIESEAEERRELWISGLHVADEVKIVLRDLARMADVVDSVYGIAPRDWGRVMPILRGLQATGLIESDACMEATDIVSSDEDGEPILSLSVRSRWHHEGEPQDTRDWRLAGHCNPTGFSSVEHIH